MSYSQTNPEIDIPKNVGVHTRLKLDLNKFDFGTILLGDTLSKTFVFQNIGNEFLIVEDVNGSCGCLATNWPKYPIV